MVNKQTTVDDSKYGTFPLSIQIPKFFIINIISFLLETLFPSS